MGSLQTNAENLVGEGIQAMLGALLHGALVVFESELGIGANVGIVQSASQGVGDGLGVSRELVVVEVGEVEVDSVAGDDGDDAESLFSVSRA